MFTKNVKFYSLVLIIVDIITLLLAFSIAYILRVRYDPRPLLVPVYANSYLVASLTIIPFWIIVFASLGLYRNSTYSRRLLEWSKLLLGSFIGVLMVIGWQYVSGRQIIPARLVIVYVFVAAFGLTVLEREIMRLIRHAMFKNGIGTQRVLLIGNSPTVADIADNLSNTTQSGYQIISVSAPQKLTPHDKSIKYYSALNEAIESIQKDRITTIIQTDLYNADSHNQKILNAAQINHIHYKFIPGEAEFYSGKNTIDMFLGYPMISVYQTPLVGWGAIAKRIFDLIISLILAIILSPLFLIIFIIKKIVDPGPAFYTSKRLSRFSQPINLYKFRSMSAKYGGKDAAEEFREMGRPDLALEYERNRKVENDPRITKFGNFLRKTSIDELPQIFNVIKGDLSLVGPRPILPQEAKLVRSKAALLHSVKSGVTGLWQVSGRNDIPFDDRIELELYYAQNWTFWLDIKILFKTIGAVFGRYGAK